MLSKNQVKFLHSLRLKKFRDMHQAFVVEGVKMVDDLMESGFGVQSVFGTHGWITSHRDLIESKKLSLYEVTAEELARASNLSTPHEVLAVVSIPKSTLPNNSNSGKIILALDRIQDPGNLGTIIRTADWFGIRHIVCSEDTVDAYNPKVVQASMGSIFRVQVFYTDLSEFLTEIESDRKVYGTTVDGINIYNFTPDFPLVILVGNESQGISPALLNLVSEKVSIPSGAQGAESLNAAVAAGIICFEFTRKLNQSPGIIV